jgi:hypothetical protein
MLGNKVLFAGRAAGVVPLAGIEPASAGYKSAALPLSENGIKKRLTLCANR